MNPDDEASRDRARRLRAESTAEERKLWHHLRAKRFDGFQFRRQHRIGPYFAHFCCVRRRLIVEIDGAQHAEREKELRDATRSEYLQEQGYRAIRFWNEQINRQLNEVLEAIYQALTTP